MRKAYLKDLEAKDVFKFIHNLTGMKETLYWVVTEAAAIPDNKDGYEIWVREENETEDSPLAFTGNIQVWKYDDKDIDLDRTIS
jgi:hypothetical protein